jgi:hypothetical protein
VLALDPFRLQPLRLSLRLSELPVEGVSGSVELDVCTESEVLLFFKGRGSIAFMFCSSTSASLDWNSLLARGCRRVNSPLPLGKEFEEKGVVACRPGFKVGMGIEEMPGCEVSVLRRLTAELLLRMCLPK